MAEEVSDNVDPNAPAPIEEEDFNTFEFPDPPQAEAPPEPEPEPEAEAPVETTEHPDVEAPEAEAPDVDEPEASATVDEGDYPEAGDAEPVFDEALLAHAKNYGLDVTVFGTPEAAQAALADLDRKALSFFQQNPAQPPQPTQPAAPPPPQPEATPPPTQPTQPAPPPPQEGFNLELDELDPDTRDVVQKMNDHYGQQFQQLQQQVAEANRQAALRLYNNWLRENGHTDLDRPDYEKLWDQSVALAVAYAQQGGEFAQLDENEIFRRSYNTLFPDRVESKAREKATKATTRRKSQVTTPANTRGRRPKPEPSSLEEMPFGKKRADAFIDEFLSERVCLKARWTGSAARGFEQWQR